MPFSSLSDFADKLNQVMPMLIREFSRLQPDEIYKGKITLPQILILDFLSSKDKIKMKDIATFMKITTPAATGIVDRLVKSGYVLRDYDKQDRRIIKILITPKGSSLLRRIKEEKRNLTIKIFQRISKSDRENYLRILTHIRDILCSGDI
jgi:MarR family transcriptional regulator, organic hydroperoxide resistance regulator